MGCGWRKLISKLMEQIGQKEGQKIKLCKVLFENESMDGMN